MKSTCFCSENFKTKSFNLDNSGPSPRMAYLSIILYSFLSIDIASNTKWCPFLYSSLATVHKSYFFLLFLFSEIFFIKAGYIIL